MSRRTVVVSFAAVALACAPGCVTLFSKVDVVRAEEARKPVQFENAAAGASFAATLKKCDGNVGGAYVGVPFVTLYSRQKSLSESARFNDAVARCDTDQNGTITEAEAKIFAGSAD